MLIIEVNETLGSTIRDSQYIGLWVLLEKHGFEVDSERSQYYLSILHIQIICGPFVSSVMSSILVLLGHPHLLLRQMQPA